MTTTLTKKSGKGTNHGVISELSAFLTVKPGYVEELRAACERFGAGLRRGDFELFRKTGLRNMRHVIFDNDTRLCWTTAFETDWDPYIDDSLDIFGAETWVDFLQYTKEYSEYDQGSSHAAIKQLLQSVQTQATNFFETLSGMTLAEIKKAQRIEQAFEQVLDNPEAAQALQQPALQPLLEQAAD
jgi:hypothetical protein